jgi:hypothetical protein
MSYNEAEKAALILAYLAKVGFAGSNPVARSRGTEKGYLSSVKGGVPKWLRERSAKPLCSGSNPLAASNIVEYSLLSC